MLAGYYAAMFDALRPRRRGRRAAPRAPARERPRPSRPLAPRSRIVPELLRISRLDLRALRALLAEL